MTAHGNIGKPSYQAQNSEGFTAPQMVDINLVITKEGYFMFLKVPWTLVIEFVTSNDEHISTPFVQFPKCTSLIHEPINLQGSFACFFLQ